MNKKIISGFLVFVLTLISIMPQQVFADSQQPVSSFRVDDVYYVVGRNNITNVPILRPTIKLSWGEAPLGIDGHQATLYDLVAYNTTLNKQENLRFNNTTDVFTNRAVDVHNEMNLDTGSLYEFTIRPRHYHIVNGQAVLANEEGTPRKVYALTDLNVELVPTEDEITVIWDDIGISDVNYRIRYAVGDHSNQAVTALTNEINVSPTTSGVTAFYDPVDRRNKFQYTVSTNIYPGQIYSFAVEPLLDQYNGSTVYRNRQMPYIFTCSTNVGLTVTEDGNYVRLGWKIPSNFKVGQGSDDEYSLNEAILYEIIDGQARTVAVFPGKTAADLEYYRIPKPNSEAEYQIVLTYTAIGKLPITAESKKVPYVPGALRVRPTQPQVPKAISQRILEDLMQDDEYKNDANKLRLKLATDYLLTGDTLPDNIYQLLNSDKTFRVNGTNTIQFVFEPFKRKDIQEGSPTYNQIITDTNVYYDIKVVTDLYDLPAAEKVVNRMSINTNNTDQVIRNSKNEIIGYRVNLSQYFSSNQSGLQNLVPGRLYYVSIEAYKEWGEEELRSKANIIPIYIDYDGNIYSPPTIVKPPLKVRLDEMTQTSITFEWKENWWEVIAVDGTKNPELAEWTTEVWVDQNGGIHTEYVEGATHYPIYESEYQVQRLKQRLPGVELISREIDLGKDPFNVSDVQYKLYTIPYDNVKNVITDQYNLIDYIMDMMKKDQSGIEPIDWKNITPTRDPASKDILVHTERGLLPNTQYLMLLLPYRVDLNGEELHALFPTPIISVTDSLPSDVNPDPTVPNLIPVDTTDITATVKWKFNTDFTYELRYSNTEDVNNAEVVPLNLPEKTDPNYPVNGDFYEQTVKDLFPNTQYYFWIRATSNNKTSAWSNSVILKTQDIAEPLPPKGVGLGSLESLRPFGYNEAQGETFLTLEWLLDPDDNPELYQDARVKKSFVYIVEIADNSRFIDPLYVELTDGQGDILPANVEKLRRNLIKINDLTPNRRYYFRLKTRVILTGPNGELLTKQSANYSSIVALLTMPSSREYDGQASDHMIILPSEYYETIYNRQNTSLTHRFRYDGVDADGGFDEFIAEQLINTLIKNNVYTYTVDIKAYDNKPITKRRVEIPYRLWSAFRDRGIDLKIVTDKATIIIPSDALNSHLNRQVNQLAERPNIVIEIEDKSTSLSLGNSGQTQLPVLLPQNIGIQLTTTKGNLSLSSTDKPINLQLKTNNRYSVYNKPLEVAYWNQSQYEWEIKKSTYNNYAGELNLQTNQLGLYYSYLTQYTNIVSTPIANTNSHWATSFRDDVLSQINLSGNFSNLDAKVSKNEYLNIMNGLLEGNRSIDMRASLNETTRNRLVKSRIALNTNNLEGEIVRQEAIAMTIKTLQNIQGRPLTTSNESTNAVNQLQGIDSSYRADIATAYSQGFISNLNQMRPNDKLTYGEMFVLLKQLLDLR
jgi:hypothetical protein